ncbi:MAG: FGGY-family carbohydrate kinase, partial [Enterobacteriaceae bacterium]
LTGALNQEYTNASTSQLLNIHSGDWEPALLEWAGVPAHWFAAPTAPGNTVGHWRTAGGHAVPVIAVATHDTASAIVATPLADSDAAYLSSGTWSLMGFESETPLLNQAALAANITNEGGAEGRYRVLKNIMGLWLLQRVMQELALEDLPQLITQSQQQPTGRFLIHPNHPRFINPPHMCQEIEQDCRERGVAIPQTAAQLSRCIFDSLALLYRQVAGELAALRGREISQLHIVGGGSQNPLLNQLCADACGLPVTAGPVEASTLGNIGCQLIALGEVADINRFRATVADNFSLHRFTPEQESEIIRHWEPFQSLSTHAKEFCL